MAFQLGDDDSHGMSEMNLVPLIDIMLVLMIIFLVTATVLNPTIPLTLPKTSASASIDAQAKIIQVSIDKENTIFIDKRKVKLTELAAELTKEKAFTAAGSENKKHPSLNISADAEAKYDSVAKVLAIASEVGLTDIAFVSDSPD